jgi:O-antigen/teichoic acid export membrane protein
MVRIISSVFLAAFSGFQKIYVIKIYELIFGIGAFLALLIAYFTKKNLITLSFYTALSSIIISLFISFHFFFFIKQLKIKKSKKKLDIISFSFLISHGSSFFKAGLISALIMISHNLIISHAVGISPVSSYSLAFRLITVSFLFSYFIGQANVALFGNILSSENISKVHTLYQIQFDLLSAAAGFVVIFLLFFSKDIIELWTHKEDLYAGINVILFLSLYGFFLVFINLYYSLITLVNNSSQLFKIVRYEYILNILLTSVFAKYFNLEGAAFALMLSALFILYFILPITIRNLSYKNLQFNPLYFNKNIIFLILFFVIVTYMTGYFNIPRLYKFFIFSLIVFLYIFCAWNFLMYDSKQLILKRIYRFNKNY